MSTFNGKEDSEARSIRQSRREGFKRIQKIKNEQDRKKKQIEKNELLKDINSRRGQIMRNCKKRAHLSRLSAIEEMKKLKSHPSGKHKNLQRVYLCDRCYTWHLTTFNPKPWKW